MIHPGEYAQTPNLRGWFTVTLLGSILLMLALNVVAAPLTTEAVPFGIVSFELAFSQPHAQKILESWDQQTALLAAFTLGLDYMFMVFYAATIFTGVRLSGRWLATHQLPLSRWGAWLAWAGPAAFILDAVENIGLTVQLTHGANSFWALLSGVSAAVKFGLIFLGLVYGLYALVMRLVARFQPARNDLQ